MRKAFCVVILVVLIIAVTSYRVHRRRGEEGMSCSSLLGRCEIDLFADTAAILN